ncbi:leucyl-tRNA synthetase [Cryptosporidium felis]|nr:leucyl-tRNA synthetase [Cryptosporidium felis]
MCLYNHSAIWEDEKKFWPRAFYCNGHLMIDSMKMSKSTGNWITLEEAICEYSADACRIALSDAGDTIDDANFCRDIANSAIMRLYSLIQSAQFYVENKEKLRGGALESSNSDLKSLINENPDSLKALNQADQIFSSEIVRLSKEAFQSYSNFAYRDALKYSLFEFQLRKDQYKLLCDSNDFLLNKNVLGLFIETQIKILAPIAPHTCEYIWRDVLGNKGFIVNEQWPKFEGKEIICGFKYSPSHSKMLTLLFKSIEDFRKSMEKWSSSKKGAEGKPKAGSAVIYVSNEYQDWQVEGLNQVQEIIDQEGGVLPKDLISRLRRTPKIEKMDKNMLKNVLSFISLKVGEYKENDLTAFNSTLPFNEFELFSTQSHFISKSLGIIPNQLRVKNTKQDCSEITGDKISQIIPSRPLITFSC